MKFPSPYLPRNQFSWSLKTRQRFARFYWSPWWNVKHFVEKWLSLYGVLNFLDRIAMCYLVWSQDKENELHRKGKAWKK